MIVYRICKKKHSPTSAAMMSGVGGLHAAGRWHSQGQLVVYTATSESLAVLEIAVNLRRAITIPEYRLLEVDIPDDRIFTLKVSDLPNGWDETTNEPLVSRAIGDRWLRTQPCVALQIPSSVVKTQNNVLLNPAHPYFSQITYGDPIDFPFDPRIKE